VTLPQNRDPIESQGKLLAWTTYGVNGQYVGEMADTDTIYTAWTTVRSKVASYTFESLYSGTPEGRFFVESSLVGAGDELVLRGVTQPDGTTYAGSVLLAENLLEGQALGQCLIGVLGISGGRVRLGYTNIAGSGLVVVRIRMVYA
jgi:hypothetical protein